MTNTTINEMKKTIYLQLIIVSAALFTSCSSALQFTETANRKEFTFDKELIEFIGFKNTYTDAGQPIENVEFLKNFGKQLEQTHIGIDRTNSYTGGYSLQRMEKYKSSKRYLSFIDVSKHSLTYNDEYGLRPKLVKTGKYIFYGALGGVVLLPAVGGVPLLIPGVALGMGGAVASPIMAAIGNNSNKCLLEFDGEYTIYIYDTLKKEVVLEFPVRVNEETTHKGQYSYHNTDKTTLSNHYETLLFNAFLEEYRKAYDILNMDK